MCCKNEGYRITDLQNECGGFLFRRLRPWLKEETKHIFLKGRKKKQRRTQDDLTMVSDEIKGNQEKKI